MSNTDQAQDAELHAMVDSLHARLVATGEWARLVKKLRGDLHGTSWESNLRNFAHDKAVQAEGQIHLSDLKALIVPEATETVPANLKHEVTATLQQFVDRNVEE